MSDKQKSYEELKAQVTGFINGKIKDGWKKLDDAILSGCDMKPMSLLLMDVPGHTWYGHVHAYMEYQGRIFQLIFRVHVPNMKSAQCANDPQCMHEWVLEEYKDIAFAKMEDSNFGQMAYWDHTPTNTLDGDDLVLRKVMDALKKWSVSNHMCARLRKTDRMHLRMTESRDR